MGSAEFWPRCHNGCLTLAHFCAAANCRQEMRLSIGGLEIHPWVWRKAFEEGGHDSDAAEDRAAGVALGYVAQVRRPCAPCLQGAAERSRPSCA